MSRKEEEARRHEYILMEIRLTGEDIKTAVYTKLEPRISALEHYRSHANGVAATLVIILGVLLKMVGLGAHK